MIKTVIVSEHVSVSKRLAEQLNLWFDEMVSFADVSLQGDLIGKIKELKPAILLTINLAGFDRTTLADNIAYNLLDCKQLHVIIDDNLKNEKELEKLLSIAMFFVCSHQKQCESLKGRYPHIPWIECMEGWSPTEDLCEDKNVEEIAKVLERVMEECQLN